MTVIGGVQLTIENHRGLLAFTDTEVAVGGARGRIVVSGERLRIGVIEADLLTLTGELRAVRFEA